MRILYIDVNCKGSSTGKIVYDLYTQSKADGNAAAVAYGRGPLVSEDEIYKFGLDWETNIHAGLARITGFNGCFSPVSTHRLIRFIKGFKPDLVHIHELHAYFVNIKPLLEYLKKGDIPVVWTFHCEYMYTGKCGYAFECTNFQNECGNCPARKDYPKSLFFDQTKQMLKRKKALLEGWKFTIVTPSQWLADRVGMSFLKEKQIAVIPNGIDTSIFHPVEARKLRAELKIPENHKIALLVAPDIMSERKGGKWILKLAEQMKNENITFALVGNAASCDVPANVLLIGEIREQRRLAEFYSMADVFLLCSQRETYSMTCAETLCCGTPVVGFRCGAPETVFMPPYATFVGYGELNELKVQIRTALAADFDRSKISEYAQERYSRQVMYKRYRAIYQNLLAEQIVSQ